MPVFKSKIRFDQSFLEKRNQYTEILERLSAASVDSRTRDPKKVEAKIRDRGKFTADERIDLLADIGSPRLVVAGLCGKDIYPSIPAGAGILTEIIWVEGRPVMVVANEPLVKGGTYFPLTVKKHLRAQQIAAENNLPCIYLVDSGGAFLPLQDEVFPDREHFGRIFYNQARMSAKGLAQISLVCGSCTAGGAYVPAMSDYSVLVEGNATVFLGGPPLVKAATGEVSSAEELGGARMHCSESGLGDYFVKNELEGIKKVREIVGHLDGDHLSPTINLQEIDFTALKPVYSAEEIPGIVSVDPLVPTPAAEIVARIVDKSEFEEFKSLYGKTVKCYFSSIYGIKVGIIANEGILFSESALKACQFIQLCNQQNTPIIFLQNVVGFMVGKNYESSGIAKDGAKLVNAVACASVPKITLIIGASYGAGNYGMCGRAYDPRFLFAWPHTQTAVMGPSQASNVLAGVKFGEEDTAEKEKYKKEISEQYEQMSDAFYSTARLWDDGIIAPSDTRKVLGLSLIIATGQTRQLGRTSSAPEGFEYGVFRM